MVGIGRVTLSKRERPIMLSPMGQGLCGVTLRYSHEVRSEAEIFARIPDLSLPDEMLEVAEHIVDTKTTDFDPANLEDRYRTALVAMLQQKQSDLPKPAASSASSPQNVVDLMDALKRSLETERPSTPPNARSEPSGTAAKPPARSSGRSRNLRAGQ
jgi:Ku protein